MKKLQVIARVVIWIAVANLIAFSTMHVLTHGNMFGCASSLIIDFASFPRTIKLVYDQLTAKVKHYQIGVDTKFKSSNSINDDLYTLGSHYNATADTLLIELLNLKNDSLIQKWHHSKTTKEIKGSHINHPLLFSDYSVAYKMENVLFRVDANSKMLWKNDELKFHHSLEQDHEGFLWSPANERNGELDLNSRVSDPNKKLTYKDELIVKVDPGSGRIIYKKSVTEIFKENNYSGFIKGTWQYDPFHLNDVQPVLTDSKFWKKGDLFLSCRNLHTVLLYRPSTGKILWLRTGLWANQHDVDVIDSMRITIFNNNVNMTYYELLHKENTGGNDERISLIEPVTQRNQIVIYNFESDSVSFLFNDSIEREKIDTESQGVFTLLSNNLGFIEETDEGKIFLVNDSVALFRKQFISPNKKFVYYPGWTRIYESIPTNDNNTNR